jgi:hypothetical protein
VKNLCAESFFWMNALRLGLQRGSWRLGNWESFMGGSPTLAGRASFEFIIWVAAFLTRFPSERRR